MKLPQVRLKAASLCPITSHYSVNELKTIQINHIIFDEAQRFFRRSPFQHLLKPQIYTTHQASIVDDYSHPNPA